MPKVKHVRARKDYPDHGISKGDMYYVAHVKTGQRSSKTLRSLTPLTPSQLTTSPFKSAWYGVQEEWECGDKDEAAMRSAAEAIRELGEEAQSSFDNMPEGLQQAHIGELLENRANEAERIAGELEGLADELEGLEEPDEPSETFDPSDFAEDTATMGPEDAAEFLSQKEQEHEEAISDWQGECDEYQTDLARLPEEAEELIGDMPE